MHITEEGYGEKARSRDLQHCNENKPTSTSKVKFISSSTEWDSAKQAKLKWA